MKKQPKAPRARKPDHLTWIEINSILGQIASQLNGALRYLPAEHPESFCQSLSVAGLAVERLANEAGAFVSNPPTTAHDHGA